MINIAKSIKDKLYHLSKSDRISFQHIIIRYLHERFLYRISISDYCDNFCLKGGTLLYAMNDKNIQRYTLDIDFSLQNMSYDLHIVKNAVIQICKIKDRDGVSYNGNSIAINRIRENDIYGGIRINVMANLGTIRQMLQIDIGYGDSIVPLPTFIDFPKLIDSVKCPRIKVYSTETVIAEKFHAMIELSELNSRMKDFYDVFMILETEKYSIDLLKEAIKSTFRTRNTNIVADHSLFSFEFGSDPNRIKMWKAFLSKIGYSNDLPFSTIMKKITNVLLPIYNEL